MFWDEGKGSGCSVAGWRSLWSGQWEHAMSSECSTCGLLLSFPSISPDFIGYFPWDFCFLLFLNIKAVLNESFVIHVARLCMFLIMPVGLCFLNENP